MKILLQLANPSEIEQFQVGDQLLEVITINRHKGLIEVNVPDVFESEAVMNRLVVKFLSKKVKK